MAIVAGIPPALPAWLRAKAMVKTVGQTSDLRGYARVSRVSIHSRSSEEQRISFRGNSRGARRRSSPHVAWPSREWCAQNSGCSVTARRAAARASLQRSFISWPESVEDESEEHEEALYFVHFVFFVVEIVFDWVLGLGTWDLGFTEADLPGRASDPSQMRSEAS